MLRHELEGLRASHRQLEQTGQQTTYDRDYFKALLDASPDAVVCVDMQRRVTSVNSAFERLFGFSHANLEGRPLLDFILPSGYESEGHDISNRVGRGEVVSTETERRKADGTSVQVWLVVAPVYVEGKLIGILGIYHDISAQKQNEARLRETEERYRALFERSFDWVYLHDLEGRFVDANPATVRGLGYSRDEFGRLDFGSLLTPGQIPRAMAMLKEIREKGTQRTSTEFRIRHKSGSYVEVETMAALVYRGGKPDLIQGIARDITQRKRDEETISRLAFYDPVTSLPNRSLLGDRLANAVKRAAREGGHLVVMMLDLDRFKDFNDRLGHHAGDGLLRLVGERLTAVLRESDTVARLGGDEFVILAPGLDGPEAASVVATKLLEAFRDSFALNGETVSVTASIGVALFPEHGQDADGLIRSADTAMYAAKEAGRNTFRTYAAHMKPGGHDARRR